MEYDLDDLAQFLAAIWPDWHEGTIQRGNLEQVHPVVFAAFDHLVGRVSSGSPVRLPDQLLPEFGQDGWQWFYTVGLNALKDRQKAERTRRRYERKAALQPNSYAFCGRAGRSAEGAFLRAEAERELHSAINRLPAKLRDVCWLVYDGYQDTEIAQQLGLTTRTVYNRKKSVKSPVIRRMLLDVIYSDTDELVPVKHLRDSAPITS